MKKDAICVRPNFWKPIPPNGRNAIWKQRWNRAHKSICWSIKSRWGSSRSRQGCLIADLYVLPSEQNKGYGTRLLAFAVTKCQSPPSLWVLSSNQRARKFYERNGFRPTGTVVQHTDTLWELEFRLV